MRPRAHPASCARSWLVGCGLATLASCGIKGPPLPPLPPAAATVDGGASPAKGPLGYRAQPPRTDAQGAWLVWRMAGPPPTDALVLVERHAAHTGGETPACGSRTIVGRVRAGAEVTWPFKVSERGATYRLLDASGAPISEAVATPR